MSRYANVELHLHGVALHLYGVTNHLNRVSNHLHSVTFHLYGDSFHLLSVIFHLNEDMCYRTSAKVLRLFFEPYFNSFREFVYEGKNEEEKKAATENRGSFENCEIEIYSSVCSAS